MSIRRAVPLLQIAAIGAALGLSACQDRASETELAKLDNQIIANETDPALTSALEDQIMVDPALTQQSNKNAVRAPASPGQAQYPLPGGGASPKQQPQQAGRAAQPAVRGASGSTAQPVQTARGAEAEAPFRADCGPQLNYNAGWSRRLPPAFAVYPGARVTDAAGSDSKDCRSRVVTFQTAAPPQRVLDFYRSRATSAGYSAEHQMREGDHVLAGTGRSGGAFYLILTPLRSGGSDVAIITNGG